MLDIPLSQATLLNLWFNVARGNQNCMTAQIWCTLQNNNPNLPIPDLIKILLSLVHYFGFDLNTDVPNTYIPNHICAGNCLAHYLCHNLCHPQSMPLHTYLTQFLLALRFLKSLKLSSALPISATKQLSIFLYSYPHHMVCQFTTNPTL